MVQLHTLLSLISQANPQVGTHTAAVYTTKIILALVRVQAAVTAFYGESGDKYSLEQSWGASQLP